MCDTLKGTIYYRDRQGLIAVDYSAQLKVSGGHMFLSNGAVSVRVSNKSLEFVQQKIVLNAGYYYLLRFYVNWEFRSVHKL